MTHDEFYLTRAFELARRGRFTTAPNPNVGCVIVRDSWIVGEGYHLRAGDPHAEIHALCMAGDAARGAAVYVTLEPCSHHGRTPSCAEALINAGVVRVVVAMSDPNPQVAGRGLHRLQEAGLNVCHNLMLPEAKIVNQGFIKRMRTGFPWVRLKLAISLDGYTTMVSGDHQWITSIQARQDVQRFRAESDAILSTSATVLADNPELNVRWSSLPEDIQHIYPQDLLRQPIRVIIDSANRVTPEHLVVQKNKGIILLARLRQDARTWPETVEQIQIPASYQQGIEYLDLMALMLHLGQREVNNVWVEAGSCLTSALLGTGLVDELILYQATKILSDNARPLGMLPWLNYISGALTFELLNVQQIGPDIRLHLKPGNTYHSS